jgi:integrase
MAKALTVKGVESLKAGPSRREVPDGLVGNLYLAVQTTGSKSWVFRPRINGKIKKITLGTHPALSLVDARGQARALAIEIAAGRDPTAKPEPVPATRGDRPIEELCRDYILAYVVPNNRKRTQQGKARVFGFTWDKKGELVHTKSKGDIISQWEGRPVNSITGVDVVDLLDAICARGSIIAANRTLAYLKGLFGWAVGRKIIETSPCEKIKAPGKEKKRQRMLGTGELKTVWDAISLFDESGAYNAKRDVCHMLILTGQRTSIVSKAKFEHFDLKDRLWLIPPDAEGNKGFSYLLPLTGEMEQIIHNCPHREGYLFSTTEGEKPLYLGNKIKVELDGLIEGLGVKMPPWVFHDLRRTMRTGLSSLAIPDGDKVRELVIGHKQTGMHEVYDLYQYLPQKRIALELWAAQVRSIVNPPEGNVIPLKTRTAASGTL